MAGHGGAGQQTWVPELRRSTQLRSVDSHAVVVLCPLPAGPRAAAGLQDGAAVWR